jgi:hypothetical protein
MKYQPQESPIIHPRFTMATQIECASFDALPNVGAALQVAMVA